MYPLLCLVAASLPFMDLEVLQVAGKSLVLPYCAALLLAIPILPRLNDAARYLSEDAALPLLVIWFLAACASSVAIFLWSQRAEILDRNLMQLANLLLMVVQYALLIVAFRSLSWEETKGVIRVLAAASVIAAVYTLYQVGGSYLGLPGLEAFRTSNLYLKINTLSPGGAGGWAGYPRAFGVAPEPSFWGGYLAFALGFVVWRPFWRFRPRDVARCGLMLAAIVVTFSRSAWLTVTVLMFAAFLIWSVRRLPRAALPLLATFVIALMFWPLTIGDQVLEAFTDASAIGRVASQRTGWGLFFDSPVLGIGFGSADFFAERYAVYLPGQGDFLLQHLYNCFLLVLVSTGILGFSLFVAFLLNVADRIAIALRVPGDGVDICRIRTGAALAYLASLGFWASTPAYNVTFVWFAFALASSLPHILAAKTATGDRQPCRARRGAW